MASYFLLAKQRETSDPVHGVETDPGIWAAGVASYEHRPYVWDISLRMLTCVCPHRSLSGFFLMWNIPVKLTQLRKDRGPRLSHISTIICHCLSSQRTLSPAPGGRAGCGAMGTGRAGGPSPMRTASSELCSQSRAAINSRILTATSKEGAVLIRIL